MTWLGGWAKRVKVTVDSGDVDSALTWFPVLIHLSSSCGKDSQDLTGIFDELGSERKKIAITKDDGDTQLYVEIEEWDDTNEEAWLWVSLNGWSIASGSDTDFYLYYDSSELDNTTYVGDPNSTPAEAVWDNDFKLVCHMLDDPDTSSTRDSTSNDNDGAKLAANRPIISTSGQIGDCQLATRNINDEIDFGTDASLNITSTVTIEAWIQGDVTAGLAGYQAIIHRDTPYVSGYGVKMYYRNATDYWLTCWTRGAAGYKHVYVDVHGSWTTTQWYYVVGTWDGTNLHIYLDGIDQNTAAGGNPADTTGDELYAFHSDHANDRVWTGYIDEARVSTGDRGASWIKACYETQRDDFLSYGSEELMPNQGGGGSSVVTSIHRQRMEQIQEPITFSKFWLLSATVSPRLDPFTKTIPVTATTVMEDEEIMDYV